MARPAPIPVNRLTAQGAESFVASIQPTDLIYFVCNVGDGDAQLLVLPEETRSGGQRLRRWVVVDAAVRNKIPTLIRATADELVGAGFSFTEGTIPLVIASHPHLDHIGGLAEVLDEFGDAVSEFWDPGYYHTVGVYHSMMTAVEQRPAMLYAQPTSGLRRWIGNVAIAVLSPSIQLRNRFDTYGVEVNDSSISIKVEYPAARAQERDKGRNLVRRRSQSLILGADAQTLSWSYVLTDYPYLAGSPSDAAKAIGGATGSDPLKGHVLKVSHHGSKHGVNLELVERIRPDLTLVSKIPSSWSLLRGAPEVVVACSASRMSSCAMVCGNRHKDFGEICKV